MKFTLEITSELMYLLNFNVMEDELTFEIGGLRKTV